MNYRPLRLLLVEDDDNDVELLQAMFRHAGLEIAMSHHVRRLADAQHHLTVDWFDAVLLDLTLPDSHGFGTIQRILEYAPDTPLVVLTGTDDETVLLNAIQAGAQDFLIKGQMTPMNLRRAVIVAIERQRIVLTLRRQALTDGLTGLLNHQGFMLLADHQLKLALRSRSAAMLIYLDLDNLKRVNDDLGHGAGDQTIKQAATLLQATFRAADLIARLGGDEFVILALTAEGLDSRTLLQRLDAMHQAQPPLAGDAPPPPFSYGVSHFNPDDPRSVEELIVIADQAMYRVKSQRG